MNDHDEFFLRLKSHLGSNWNPLLNHKHLHCLWSTQGLFLFSDYMIINCVLKKLASIYVVKFWNHWYFVLIMSYFCTRTNLVPFAKSTTKSKNIMIFLYFATLYTILWKVLLSHTHRWDDVCFHKIWWRINLLPKEYLEEKLLEIICNYGKIRFIFIIEFIQVLIIIKYYLKKSKTKNIDSIFFKVDVFSNCVFSSVIIFKFL